MATFEIQGPDGKTYEIDAPDQDSAVAAFQKFSPAQQPAPQQQGFGSITPTNPGFMERTGNALYDAGKAIGLPVDQMRRDNASLDAGVRGIADTATFGTADELSGALGAATGVGGQFGNYSGNRDFQRAIDRSDEEQHPGARLAGQIGGGFLNPTKSVGEAVLGKAATLGGAAVRSAIDGSLFGGLYGAGSGEGVQDRLKQAGTGAVTGGVIGAAAPYVAAGGSKTLGAFNRKPVVPSPEDLAALKNRAYQTVDDMGVQYTPNAFNDMIAGMTDEVKAANISPMRHPKAASMMTDIQALKDSSPTLTQMDQLRQVIRRDVANAPDDAEAFFGKKMMRNLGEFVDSAPPVVSGDAAKGAEAIRNARDLNTRLMKTQDVQDAVESARLRAASTGSGGNEDNATRQNIRRVLEGGNFTPDEKAALEKVVTGTKGQNLLRLAGKLSPQGNGLMAALGVGGAMTNPVLGIPALVGVGAKTLADRTTKKNVQDLLNVIAVGGSKAAVKAPKNAAQKTIDANRDAIMRMLLGAGVPSMTQR